jgi:hypothetical protein
LHVSVCQRASARACVWVGATFVQLRLPFGRRWFVAVAQPRRERRSPRWPPT